MQDRTIRDRINSLINSHVTNSHALKTGDITPFIGRGTFGPEGKRSVNIRYSFMVARYDATSFCKQDGIFRMLDQNKLSHIAYPFYNVITTWTGDKIVQTGQGIVPIGTYWNENKLSKDISFVHVRNGNAGTVGLRFRLDDIQEGAPIVFTCGQLSGCTSIYSVDDEYLYVLHTGTNLANAGWKTDQDGIKYTAHVLAKLTGYPTSRVIVGRENQYLRHLFFNFNRTTITYHGKNGEAVFDGNDNIRAFDYDNCASSVEVDNVFDTPPRVGSSYCLVARHQGRITVKTYSDDSEIIINKGNPRNSELVNLGGMEHTLL